MSPPSDFPRYFSRKQKISPVFHDKLQRLQVGETILSKNQAGHITAPDAKIHKTASGKAILGVCGPTSSLMHCNRKYKSHSASCLTDLVKRS